MIWKDNLKNKIKAGSAIIGLVGLGYVGLPLAVAFSKKFNVVGYNINEEKIELLKTGKSYNEDIEDKEINLKKLYPTSDHND